ncbi:hypothetical protein Agabi119p4_6164 [Agaricus bisporus var. burnettii]|uniref:Mannoprotein n=1 Tax=Agaricus bisporus var. burnettii TaxID=192524 RepID=A0A8H7KFT5_AGABI|nr:hypothetical protein Agabi119p4_6164 [Agaricus bisporus var. burnettii]
MSPSTLLNVFVLAALSLVGANAQVTYPATPLASKTFTYPSGIPEKVDTDTGLIRGFQHGYNQCNSTTEGPNSLCQTSFINSIDDFCLWAPGEPGSVVANTEGEMVAWCTKPGRGTRLIPQYALQGVQFIKTPNYVQVAGFIRQELINIDSADYGGEMDPHGADLRGNPMGGLIYSNAFGGDGGWTQVIEWHNFMGGNGFCLKACDPNKPDDEKYCEHRLDRIGCAYNAPNNAQNGTFESCEGENQDFPGVYTVNGQVMTYAQPPESEGPITTMPYTARIPASSNCVTYTSSALYTDLPSPSIQIGAVSTALPSGASGSGSPSGSRTGAAAGAQNTSNDASSLAISGVSFLGVVFSILFLA